MRYRVDYYPRMDTMADAEAVSLAIEEAILTEDPDYERSHGPIVYQDGDSHLKWVASGGGWFTTQAKARKLHRVVETGMNNDARMLPGSFVDLHPCNNEDVAACLPEEVERITKAG